MPTASLDCDPNRKVGRASQGLAALNAKPHLHLSASLTVYVAITPPLNADDIRCTLGRFDNSARVAAVDICLNRSVHSLRSSHPWR